MADNRIAYGILKAAKVNTEGMSPKQAWLKVKELGLLGRAKSYGYNDDELDALFDEINNFHPTPEMERVIEKAKGIAEKVTVTTNAHENFEKAIDHLIALKDKYGFEMLEEIRTEDRVGANPASVREKGNVLVLSNGFLENPESVLEKDKKDFEKIIEEYNELKKVYDILVNVHTSNSDRVIEFETEYIEVAKKYAFGRCHVGITTEIKADAIMECVITHEVGHIISNRFHKEKIQHIVDVFNRLSNQYNQIEKLNDVVPMQLLSLRATDNAAEFFSELFVAFNSGDSNSKALIQQFLGGIQDEYKRFLEWLKS